MTSKGTDVPLQPKLREVSKLKDVHQQCLPFRWEMQVEGRHMFHQIFARNQNASMQVLGGSGDQVSDCSLVNDSQLLQPNTGVTGSGHLHRGVANASLHFVDHILKHSQGGSGSLPMRRMDLLEVGSKIIAAFKDAFTAFTLGGQSQGQGWVLEELYQSAVPHRLQYHRVQLLFNHVLVWIEVVTPAIDNVTAEAREC